MVVRMIRWPSWLPMSKKLEAKVVIQRLEGLNLAQNDDGEDDESGGAGRRRKTLVVEIIWKGQKGMALVGPLRRKRSMKRNLTEEGGFCGDGVFEWNEEFRNVCSVSMNKDGVFSPWEIAFSVLTVSNQDPTNSVPVGTATLNLAEFASTAIEKELEIEILVQVPSGSTEGSPSLRLSIRLLKLQTVLDPPQMIRTLKEPLPESPIPTSSQRKDELFGFRASLKRMATFRRVKKPRNEEGGINDMRNYSFNKDSLDSDFEGQPDEESNGNNMAMVSHNYEPITYANLVRGSFFSNGLNDNENDDWKYYNNAKQDLVYSESECVTGLAYEQQPLRRSFKSRILPWTGKKLYFQSSKQNHKGEPLLKKDYREEGGDDIDFDRRQLSSSDESSLWWSKSEAGSTTSRSSTSEFGDDHFAVGSWELKEIVSRDGHMKLLTHVFFASIDQRSERAAGESACTALVAVIANWLQSNKHEVPTKSEFDSLIRDGSLEWRNLCQNENYMEQFPDKHFDLETVLEAKSRPISVVHEKSFIGFFHPEDLEGGGFEFLSGAMSFDCIWEEINCTSNSDHPLIYIVSWNDHFFILKVDKDTFYIIDTLGERLYEGCNQAYILKFDKSTTITRVPDATTKSSSDDKTTSNTVQPKGNSTNEAGNGEGEEVLVYEGIESCKEYIKSFLAAIPIRELQTDIKRVLMGSTTSLHHRLQIEFHYTELTQCPVECSLPKYACVTDASTPTPTPESTIVF